jgi:DNA-binding transcriptional ArsR family regulator
MGALPPATLPAATRERKRQRDQLAALRRQHLALHRRRRIVNRVVKSDSLDEVFAALSDPTRRAIVVRLTRGEATVGELAEPFPMSLPAVSKHLTVLERAGLVHRERRGRHQYCRLRTRNLSAAASWLDRHRRFWSGRLEALAEHVREEKP